MNRFTITLLTTTVGASAAAQSGHPCPSAPSTPVPVTYRDCDPLSPSNFSFSEEINFFNLHTEPNVTQFLSTVEWKTPIKDLSASLTLPVYTDGVTGAGMLGVGVDWTALHNPVSFVDTLDLALDLKLPTSSAGYGGTGVNPVLGAATGGSTPLERLTWNAGATWEWNSNGDYFPVFGGFTTEDYLTVTGGLGYELTDTLAVGANYGWNYLDNGASVNTVGPALQWTPCPNAELGFHVDIPFSNNNASELDLVVGFGAGIKF